jgi:manganese/iron transport system ATP-binding protein
MKTMSDYAMSPAAPLTLDVTDVSVSYPSGQRALHDTTFHLTGGTICALVGVNGSGKSTLFKSVMGFIRPNAGTVEINGRPVRDVLKDHLVAYVPQAEEVDWQFPVSVADVVMMGRYGAMNFMRIPRSADKRAVEESLRRVSMWEFRDRQIGELSGGQKKRVFLARALAQGGRIILLDEPFTGVDVKTEEAIIALLRELREAGCIILVSTHNLGSVPEFCDQVVLINRRAVKDGSRGLQPTDGPPQAPVSRRDTGTRTRRSPQQILLIERQIVEFNETTELVGKRRSCVMLTLVRNVTDRVTHLRLPDREGPVPVLPRKAPHVRPVVRNPLGRLALQAPRQFAECKRRWQTDEHMDVIVYPANVERLRVVRSADATEIAPDVFFDGGGYPLFAILRRENDMNSDGSEGVGHNGMRVRIGVTRRTNDITPVSLCDTILTRTYRGLKPTATVLDRSAVT